MVGKRLFDIVASFFALVFLAPVLLLTAIGIRLSSEGPILYQAPRIGWRGRPFIMFKFRTMHVDHGQFKSCVTANKDPRVFPFGNLLRKLKIDELPQLVNVLVGDMSVIGPRPEVPDIVAKHYSPLDRETLNVLPGLASPGSIYHYTHGHRLIGNDDLENAYLTKLMPVKLAMDVIYVRTASFSYDLRLIKRVLMVIVDRARGRKYFPDPPEMEEARKLLVKMNG